jgi:hypothetical protein
MPDAIATGIGQGIASFLTYLILDWADHGAQVD